MPRRARLDAELVRRGLARSREHAAELVRAGRVQVAGRPAGKPATAVAPADPVRLVRDGAGDTALDTASDAPGGTVGEKLPTTRGHVSRGGDKLAGALTELRADGLTVAGRRCLDAGASTGGFTDVLLRAGASQVVAVDVGYGQLAWRLRTDPRVVVLERTNVRTLRPDRVGGAVGLTVADLSFISLRLVLPALIECTEASGDLVLLVKPQFEAGRGRVGTGGVVRDLDVRAETITAVAEAAGESGWGTAGLVASQLAGPKGNREFFLWLRAGAPPVDQATVRRVVAEAGR